MARLIRSTEFDTKLDEGRLDPSWYFVDAFFDRYTRDEGRWRYTIERTYPFSVYMHRDTLVPTPSPAYSNGERRVEIARWIAASLANDVILTYSDRFYRYRAPNKNGSQLPDPYSEPFGVQHGYHVFHFVKDSEMIHFRLQFAHWITADSDVSARHPDYGHINELQIEPTW